MSPDTMTLHRFNGAERFRVAMTTVEVADGDDGSFSVTFRAEAGEALQTVPDPGPYEVQPVAEWTVAVAERPDEALRAGRRFLLPEGDPDPERDSVARLWYFEQAPMDDSEIVVLAREGARVRARITGTAPDVNHYDGSKPPTQVVVEADFTLDA